LTRTAMRRGRRAVPNSSYDMAHPSSCRRLARRCHRRSGHRQAPVPVKTMITIVMSTAPEGDRTIGGSRSGSGIWGKVAVVTGSSKGIGKAVARKLGEGGASVVINARSADEIKSAEEELRGLGCEVSGSPSMWPTTAVPKSFVAHAAERYGPVGLAGEHGGDQPSVAPLLEIEQGAFSKTLVVNTWTAVAMVQAGIRHGLLDQHGAVVNVSTVGARQYQPQLAAYCASKAALEV